VRCVARRSKLLDMAEGTAGEAYPEPPCHPSVTGWAGLSPEPAPALTRRRVQLTTREREKLPVYFSADFLGAPGPFRVTLLEGSLRVDGED
jgi:hypothetical protein